MNRFVGVVLILINAVAIAGPDYEREKRWHDEITPSIVVGEAKYIKQKNGHQFLGIYTEANTEKMGLVVVHGMGIHPDWGMVNTLRERLAEHGYSTFSIQMPVLASTAAPDDYPAIYPDAAERLRLAVDFMNKQGYKHVAVVSHSNGSRMSRYFLSKDPSGVAAWAALSLTKGDTFEGINIPILDLYGSEDLTHVIQSVPARKKSLQNNKHSRQVVIKGADHFYGGKEGRMVSEVKLFLDDMK